VLAYSKSELVEKGRVGTILVEKEIVLF